MTREETLALRAAKAITERFRCRLVRRPRKVREWHRVYVTFKPRQWRSAVNAMADGVEARGLRVFQPLPLPWPVLAAANATYRGVAVRLASQMAMDTTEVLMRFDVLGAKR